VANVLATYEDDLDLRAQAAPSSREMPKLAAARGRHREMGAMRAVRC
jgi:hypothetical protein